LKELISSQVESEERFRWTLHTGGLLWDPMAGCYQESSKKNPEEIVRKPHLIGVTQKIEQEQRDSWKASWVGSLFYYHPPRCGFSRSEQRMLLMALEGGTDRELSQALSVSISTVKKMWLSVYRRMDDHLPRINPNHSQPETKTIGRGKEKKHRLLAYVRKHPEELRPVSQKLLSQAATEDRPRS